jgi:hypothetical protein
MADVVLTIGDFTLIARYETKAAPQTCAVFRRLLPLNGYVLHVRWSGQAVWVPLGDLDTGLPPENATSYPSPGEILFYPGGISESEILIPYSGTRFASKAGQLAGNHFLTITSGTEHLAEIGRLALWKGAQSLSVHATQ